MKHLSSLASLIFSTSLLSAQTPVIKEAIPISEIVAAAQISETESEAVLHLPYPIIFVHGLNSSFNTWFEMWSHLTQTGLSYGGHLPYCLNSDNDLYHSNIYSTATTDIESFLGATSPVVPGDFYLIDFDVDPDGFYGHNSVQSNQAAIIKQAVALRHAISAILQITGRDKVILFGHSMGGLASRTYLQNTSLWQTDGKHHVAKLITSGTPHFGNDMTSLNLTEIFDGANEKSDAVRDLRGDFDFWGEPHGICLWGGNESNVNSFFYSKDINCNANSSSTIPGLNNLAMPQNIDISCVVGNFNIIGDGIVLIESADLKNVYDYIQRETFTTVTFHTWLTSRIQSNTLALDEPDDFHLAYQIDFNKIYWGRFTEQGDGGNWLDTDYDDYLFTMPQSGFVKLMSWSLPTSNVGMHIVRGSDETYIHQTESNGAASMETSLIWLSAGEYYFELATSDATASWQNQYAFEIQSSVGSSAVDAPEWVLSAALAPNPATDHTTFSATFGADTEGFITLTDALGRVVQSQPFTGDALTHTFDLTDATPGSYFVTLLTAGGVKSWTLLKQ